METAYSALVPERRVCAVLHAGAWADVGTPRAYLAANLAVLDGGLRIAAVPGGAFACGSWFGPEADVRGRVTRCVVGTRAVVPAGADLVECVLLDGARAPVARLVRAIVYGDEGVVDAS
jgi:glucose-1-phosphate adenylyltransferase